MSVYWNNNNIWDIEPFNNNLSAYHFALASSAPPIWIVSFVSPICVVPELIKPSIWKVDEELVYRPTPYTIYVIGWSILTVVEYWSLFLSYRGISSGLESDGSNIIKFVIDPTLKWTPFFSLNYLTIIELVLQI